MKKNVKKHDFMVGLSYLAFVFGVVALEACGPSGKLPSTDAISCDQANDSFAIRSSDERLKLKDLKPGLYDYAGGEFYFEGSEEFEKFKIQTGESVQKNPDSKQVDLTHEFLCREGYSKSDSQMLRVSDEAPRLLMIRSGSDEMDVVERSFAMGLEKGFPRYHFSEDEKSIFPVRRADYAKKLAADWDQYFFVHTGIKQYAFIARKRLPEGTLWVKIRYISNVLEKSDILMALPDSLN